MLRRSPRLRYLVLAALVLGACSTMPAEETTLGVWSSEVALEGGMKLGGCVVADLDPAAPEAEVGVVRVDGAVLMLSRGAGGTWSARPLAALPGEAIQCAAADLVPELPGEELVTVGAATGGEDDGGPGAAWLISTAPGQAPRKIFESDQLLHALAIGDLDPSLEGQEILVAGYDRKAWLLHRDGERWDSRLVATLPGQAKGAALAKGGIVVGQADGSLSRIWRDGDGLWHTELLLVHPDSLARLAGEGDAVLFCSNDGALRWLGRGIPQTVLRSGDRLRGAVISDLLPRHSGPELATAGYDGAITVAWETRLGFGTGVVARDPDRLHHLACGVLPGLGRALVACGYGGRVLVASPSTRAAASSSNGP